MQRKWKHTLVIFAFTFLLSVLVNLSSNSLLSILPLTLSFVLLFFVIFVGVVFDVLGVAAAAGEETPYHAMASNRIAGAKEAIWLVRNADTVANFACDIVGDIAGTLSGSIGAAIVFQIVAISPTISETLFATVMIALVAAFTVGGKAYGKSVAISRAVEILYLAGRVLHTLEKFGVKYDSRGKNKQKKR